MNKRAINSTRRPDSGNALIEFTLVGIPIIFLLISIFEISRGMWIYHSLAYSAKSATRFASVHGKNCEVPPNSCQITVRDVSSVIQDGGSALLPAETTVTFSMGGDAGIPSSGGSDFACTLQSCLTSPSYQLQVWPDDRTIAGTPPDYRDGNAVGNTVTITVATDFRSALAFFWPGTTPFAFGTIRLSASSTDQIQF